MLVRLRVMLTAALEYVRLGKAWWREQWSSINGDNREGDWSEPDPPEDSP